jgi:hypothetical protein
MIEIAEKKARMNHTDAQYELDLLYGRRPANYLPLSDEIAILTCKDSQ